MSFKKLMTKKGYDFFEASSAFQKAVRRGDEDRALFFAAEFYDSNYDEYIWKRIRVITCEDIGLANPTLPATIHALYSTYKELKKKEGGQPSERLMLIQAVLLLVRSPKSRLVCYASIATFRQHEATKLEILDSDLDIHTRRGKKMKRDYTHFFQVAAHLENMASVPRERVYEKAAYECLLAEQNQVETDGTQTQLFDE